jgi:hypothetical protein
MGSEVSEHRSRASQPLPETSSRGRSCQSSSSPWYQLKSMEQNPPSDRCSEAPLMTLAIMPSPLMPLSRYW